MDRRNELVDSVGSADSMARSVFATLRLKQYAIFLYTQVRARASSSNERATIVAAKTRLVRTDEISSARRNLFDKLNRQAKMSIL